MQPRDNNQRPISRQSYSGYRAPSTDGFSAPQRRVEPQPLQPQAPAPEPVQQPVYNPEPQPQQPPQPPQPQVDTLKPVWDTAPVQPLIPSQPSPPTQQQPEPTPVEPSPVPAIDPAPAPIVAPQVNPFEAPSKKKQKEPKIKKPRRKISLKKPLKILGIILGAVGIGAAVFYFVSPYVITPDPAVLLKDGIKNSLTNTSIQVENIKGLNSTTGSYNLADPKDPVVSTKFNGEMYGGVFEVSTYGTNDNTFISYDKVPSVINPAITSKLKGWVQLRNAGKLDADTSHQLTNLADPRYQIFGPVIFGNYDEKTATEITNFMISNNVYKIQSSEPAKATVNGQRAIAIPVAISVGYLKVAIQSAALGMGYSPSDIADIIRNLDEHKGAKGDMYITQRGHKIVKFVVTDTNGSQTQLTYSNFDKATTAAQPSGATAWKQFAPTQWQIEAQTYAKQKGSVLDIVRKSAVDSLHTNLASYNAQKGYYPSMAAMNNLSWLANIPLGIPEMQKDPLGINLNLAAAPTPKYYAYLPTPANCDNVKVACTNYQLVSSLSNGKQYIVGE